MSFCHTTYQHLHHRVIQVIRAEKHLIQGQNFLNFPITINQWIVTDQQRMTNAIYGGGKFGPNIRLNLCIIPFISANNLINFLLPYQFG